MARRAEPLVRSVEQLKEGAKYLKIADQLVREGKYDVALKEIAKARAANPSNLYALAYEDRVRSLLQANDGEKSKEQRGRLKPAIEQLSSLAVVQAQRSLDNELKKEKALQSLQKENDERLSLDEVRKAAIQEKIQSFITRVIEYQAKSDFPRALAEIDRAYLLDPMNEQVRILEGEIRNQLQEQNKNKKLELQRLREEEEHQRSELISSEQEKIQQEIDEKKRRAEDARRVAQEQKVQQYVRQSKHLLAAGQLDDALSELAFVVVIDPLNEDVLSLERVIRERMEKERKEQLAREKRQEEERVKRIEAVQVTVAKHIERANNHARQGDFDEALRVITRAYVIDPLSKDLMECETSILLEQDRRAHALTEEQVRKKEEQAKRREEELRSLEKAERDRLLAREHLEEEKRKKQEKNKIGEYLTRARKYARDNQFESALGELALAFVLDPFDEEVKDAEQEIITMREGISLQSEVHPSSAEEAITHFENAQRMRKASRFDDALEELAKAFVLDPLNPAIQKLDDEIHEEYRTFQAAEKQIEVEQEPSARENLWRAMELLDRSEHCDALREVENGLSLEPQNEDLLTLRSEIEKIIVGTSTIEECIARAGEFLAEEKYHKALKEVEAGLNEFPNSIELLGLRSEIENARDKEVERIIIESRRLLPEGNQEDVRILLEKGFLLSPDNSLLQEISRELDEEGHSGDETILRHIEMAKENLRAGTYEEALAQIALGLTVDPENKELRGLEAETWRRSGNDRAGEDPDTRSSAEEVKEHLQRAMDFHDSDDFASALDEVAKAYALDPLNPEIRSVENRIRQTELRQQKEETPLKLIYPDQKRVGHS